MCDPATLGKLKLEHTFKEEIFVMPKVYYLELEGGTTINKCKGFPDKLTKDQYLALLGGDSLGLSMTKWARSLRESSIQIQRNTPYSMNFIFNKRPQTKSSVVQIYNISGSPNPEAKPFSSDSVNVQWSKEVKAETKRAADRTRKSAKATALDPTLVSLEAKLDSMGDRIVDAIKSIPSTATQAAPSADQSSLNPWLPIIQGVVSSLAVGLGLNVSSPISGTSSTSPSPVLEARIKTLESKLGSLESLVTKLAEGQENLTTSITDLAQGKSPIEKSLFK